MFTSSRDFRGVYAFLRLCLEDVRAHLQLSAALARWVSSRTRGAEQNGPSNQAPSLAASQFRCRNSRGRWHSDFACDRFMKHRTPQLLSSCIVSLKKSKITVPRRLTRSGMDHVVNVAKVNIPRWEQLRTDVLGWSLIRDEAGRTRNDFSCY